MSWVERTFEEVEPPDETSSETNVQLEDMLRNLPPYMKIKTRRARKALARYETRKQKYIENLRQNALYKFVMQVAAFTNEDIQKYWKGKSLTPFIEEFSPEPIAISKEDLNLMYKRAKENAYSDLHQFCRRIRAIPMFEWEEISAAATSGGDAGGAEDAADEDDAAEDDAPPAEAVAAPAEDAADDGRNLSTSPSKVFSPQDNTRAKIRNIIRGTPGRGLSVVNGEDPPSGANYIYNMSDTEFEAFVTTYIDEAYKKKKYRDIREYLLAATGNTFQGFKKPFPAAKHTYPKGIYMDESVNDKFTSLDNRDSDPVNVIRTTWEKSVPIVRWDDPYAEFWFQRYVARWLVSEGSNDGKLIEFRKKYRAMFNNVVRGRDGVYYRDLTGMSFTYRSSEYDPASDDETILTKSRATLPKFVAPLFDQRVEWWRHELVLGEYEKRSMVQADQWLQKTPWALGKIYLEPSLYGHMIEAHTAIMTKFKKFSNVKLEDLVRHEKHSYFLSKLVAMCIRTSAILSGKKYGLDKAYMRVNLEKRRLLYAWSKLEPPRRGTRRTYWTGEHKPEDRLPMRHPSFYN